MQTDSAHGRHDDRRRHERQHTEVGGREQRRPVGPEQEVAERDLAEELDRRAGERDHDAGGRRDRDGGAQAEQPLTISRSP